MKRAKLLGNVYAACLRTRPRGTLKKLGFKTESSARLGA